MLWLHGSKPYLLKDQRAAYQEERHQKCFGKLITNLDQFSIYIYTHTFFQPHQPKLWLCVPPSSHSCGWGNDRCGRTAHDGLCAGLPNGSSGGVSADLDAGWLCVALGKSGPKVHMIMEPRMGEKIFLRRFKFNLVQNQNYVI